MGKKRGTTRAPSKEEDPSRTSSSIATPEVEALQATIKQSKKDQLEQLQETLAFTESQLSQSQVALQMGRDKQNETMNLFQQRIALSSSPNTLKPRQPRPQDLAYKAAIDQQQDHLPTPEPPAQTDHVMNLLANLTRVMKDSNKSDIALPPKFNGKDEKWEQWHK
jgi:hypothetical protein